MRRLLVLGLVATTLALGGCITTVDVKKLSVDPTAAAKTRGLRYSLPATYLLVQPQADGTATYNWVYLPDPANSYVVNKKSLLAKFTLDVATTNGILSSVEAAGDATAVAAKLLDSTQAVYAAREAAAAKVSTAATTAQASAKTSLSAATLAVAQAQSERDITNADASASTTDKRAAQIKLANAQLALTQATTAANALGVTSADLVTPPKTTKAPGTRQYGPMLFRVVLDGDGVKLVSVKKQEQFDTVVAATAPSTTAAAAPAAPSFACALAAGTSLKAGKALTFTVNVAPPVAGADAADSTLNAGILPSGAQMALKPAADGKSFTVTIKKGLAFGPYTLIPAVIPTPGATAVNCSSVALTVDAH
jgi:hypothetical protein